MGRNRRLLIAATLAVLSVGWLAPLAVAATLYLTGFEHLVRGDEGENSFPYFQAGSEALRLGAIWCGLAAVVWATCGINHMLQAARHATPHDRP